VKRFPKLKKIHDRPCRSILRQSITAMWIPRTKEEQDRWTARTHAQARSFALGIGILVFIGVTSAMYFGVSLVAAHRMFMGPSSRPMGLIGALLAGAFIGLGVFRDVRRSELKKHLSLTICPRCGTMGQLNEGEKCGCGGEFVKTSKVRWVDEPVDGNSSQGSEASSSNHP